MPVPRMDNGQFIGRYDADEPRACVDCGEVKPGEEFHTKIYNKDRTPRRRQSYCKLCARLRNRKRYNRRPRTRQTPEEVKAQKRDKYRRDMLDPERAERKRAQGREAARRRRERAKEDEAVRAAIRAARKRWEAKVYADPVRHEATLEAVRERYWLRSLLLSLDPERYATYVAERRMDARLRTGAVAAKPTAIDAWTRRRDDVPARPFLDWIDEAFPGKSPESIESATGLNAKTLRNMRAQSVVSLGIVDAALTVGLGRPDLVAALYPVE